MAGFPGTADSTDDAGYVLVGAPLDVSSSFRPGARFGPDQIRHFATPSAGFDHQTDQELSTLLADAGDIEAWTDVPDYLGFVEGVLTDHHAAARLPVLVGGEHTVTVAGLRAATPDIYVCLDAHLDLHTEYAGDPYSHATVTHHALEVADRAIIVGARTGSADEWARADADNVTVVPPADISTWTPSVSGDIYLSVDIDVADPGYAPASTTPEPFGLTPREIKTVIKSIAPHAVGFDLVEVTDRDHGQTASLAAGIIREFVYTHATTSTDPA